MILYARTCSACHHDLHEHRGNIFFARVPSSSLAPRRCSVLAACPTSSCWTKTSTSTTKECSEVLRKPPILRRGRLRSRGCHRPVQAQLSANQWLEQEGMGVGAGLVDDNTDVAPAVEMLLNISGSRQRTVSLIKTHPEVLQHNQQLLRGLSHVTGPSRSLADFPGNVWHQHICKRNYCHTHTHSYTHTHTIKCTHILVDFARAVTRLSSSCCPVIHTFLPRVSLYSQQGVGWRTCRCGREIEVKLLEDHWRKGNFALTSPDPPTTPKSAFCCPNPDKKGANHLPFQFSIHLHTHRAERKVTLAIVDFRLGLGLCTLDAILRSKVVVELVLIYQGRKIYSQLS
eukprot:713244-Pelagomonas_calceolata.AAC.4